MTTCPHCGATFSTCSRCKRTVSESEALTARGPDGRATRVCMSCASEALADRRPAWVAPKRGT